MPTGGLAPAVQPGVPTCQYSLSMSQGDGLIDTVQVAMFTCGIVLLLNIWGGKRSGLATDAQKEMADVHKCMKMLKMLEPQ